MAKIENATPRRIGVWQVREDGTLSGGAVIPGRSMTISPWGPNRNQWAFLLDYDTQLWFFIDMSGWGDTLVQRPATPEEQATGRTMVLEQVPLTLRWAGVADLLGLDYKSNTPIDRKLGVSTMTQTEQRYLVMNPQIAPSVRKVVSIYTPARGQLFRAYTLQLEHAGTVRPICDSGDKEKLSLGETRDLFCRYANELTDVAEQVVPIGTSRRDNDSNRLIYTETGRGGLIDDSTCNADMGFFHLADAGDICTEAEAAYAERFRDAMARLASRGTTLDVSIGSVDFEQRLDVPPPPPEPEPERRGGAGAIIAIGAAAVAAALLMGS